MACNQKHVTEIVQYHICNLYLHNLANSSLSDISHVTPLAQHVLYCTHTALHAVPFPFKISYTNVIVKKINKIPGAPVCNNEIQ